MLSFPGTDILNAPKLFFYCISIPKVILSSIDDSLSNSSIIEIKSVGHLLKIQEREQFRNRDRKTGSQWNRFYSELQLLSFELNGSRVMNQIKLWSRFEWEGKQNFKNVDEYVAYR